MVLLSTHLNCLEAVEMTQKKRTDLSPASRSARPKATRGGSPAKADKKLTAAEAERELDEALEQSFPASDPVAMESTLVSGGRR